MASGKSNYLFLCAVNTNRSPTAAVLFERIATGRGLEVEVRSAGMDIQACEHQGTNPMSQELADWADVIFTMDSYIELIRDYTGFTKDQPQKTEIHKWHIPDIYLRNDPKLIRILEEKINNYLDAQPNL